jgi:hypothetical protein
MGASFYFPFTWFVNKSIEAIISKQLQPFKISSHGLLFFFIFGDGLHRLGLFEDLQEFVGSHFGFLIEEVSGLQTRRGGMPHPRVPA